jgi:hypothetical protein
MSIDALLQAAEYLERRERGKNWKISVQTFVCVKMARVVAGLLLGSELERERERKTLCRVVVCVESCVVATLCVRAGGGGGWWRSLRGRIRKFVVSKSIISFTVCVYGRRPLLCFFLSLLVVIFRLYFFKGEKMADRWRLCALHILSSKNNHALGCSSFVDASLFDLLFCVYIKTKTPILF